MNIGNPLAPMFGDVVLNPFGINLELGENEAFAFPTIGDIDLDGDLDILFGTYQGNLNVFTNVGTITNPSFDTFQVNPYSLTPGSYFALPQLVDLDADGDLDIMTGTYDGMSYYENGPVGISSESLENLIQIYPNPASSFLNIKTDLDIISIEVFDLLGKTCGVQNSNNKTLDIGKLEPGIYTVQILLKDNTSFTKKITKL